MVGLESIVMVLGFTIMVNVIMIGLESIFKEFEELVVM